MMIPSISFRNIVPNFRSCRVASMAWESKRDHEAIMTYNKLLKKPPSETTYSASELRMAKKFFDKIKEYRRRSQEGFEPSKLFMVWRYADVSGRPYWEKFTLMELGLTGNTTDYVVVKNTPSMNKKLWSIKHLIRIRPITFPNGFPTDEDVNSAFLKQTGELVVSPRLKTDVTLLEPDLERKQKTLDHRTIKENLRLRWDKGYPRMS